MLYVYNIDIISGKSSIIYGYTTVLFYQSYGKATNEDRSDLVRLIW